MKNTPTERKRSPEEGRAANELAPKEPEHEKRSAPERVCQLHRIDDTSLVIDEMQSGDLRIDVQRPDHYREGRAFSIGFVCIRPGELARVIDALLGVQRRRRRAGGRP